MSLPLWVPVTALTAQITDGGRFQPGNAVVRVIPGQPIILEMIQRNRHNVTPKDVLMFAIFQSLYETPLPIGKPW
jgi:hypothetical protein